MAVIADNPLASTLAGVPAIRCLGVSQGSGDDIPNGVDDALFFRDGWLGCYVNRLTHPYDDNLPGEESSRTEITWNSQAPGTEAVYSWEWKLPDEGWPVGIEFLIMQMHERGVSPQPTVANEFELRCDGESVRIYVPETMPPKGDEQAFSGVVGQFRVSPGVPNQMCLRARWGQASDGYLILTHNGRTVLHLRNLTTTYPSHVNGPYLRMGVYQIAHGLGGWVDRLLFVRNVRIIDTADPYSLADLAWRTPLAPRTAMVGG